MADNDEHVRAIGDEEVYASAQEAQEILARAVAGDYEGAQLRILAALAAGRSLAIMMLAWCDIAIHASPPEATCDMEDVVFYDPTSGETKTAEEVDKAVAWAGEFYLARVRGNEPRCKELFLSSGDDEEFKASLWALVVMCAENIRWYTAVH